MRDSARKNSASINEKLASLAGVATVMLGAGATAEAGIVAAQNVPIGPPSMVNAQTDWDVDGSGTVDFTFENFLNNASVAKAWIHERGAARFVATNVCRRCVVPSRDSRTGAETAWFRDAFEARRGRSLRPDVDTSAWSHVYRLAVNTTATGAASRILIDDPVTG